MKNKDLKIIFTALLVGVLIFGTYVGALPVKAQTPGKTSNQPNEKAIIAVLEALIRILTQMLNQLLAQKGLTPTTTTETTTQAIPKITISPSCYDPTKNVSVHCYNSQDIIYAISSWDKCYNCHFGSSGWYIYDSRNSSESNPGGVFYFLKSDPCTNKCNAICGLDGHTIINSCDNSIIFTSPNLTCKPKEVLNPVCSVSDIPSDTSPGSCVYLCKLKGYKDGYCESWSPDLGQKNNCETGPLKGLSIGETKDCKVVSFGSTEQGILSPDLEGRTWNASCCCTNFEGG